MSTEENPLAGNKRLVPGHFPAYSRRSDNIPGNDLENVSSDLWMTTAHLLTAKELLCPKDTPKVMDWSE